MSVIVDAAGKPLRTTRGALTGVIAGSDSDPQYYSQFDLLPNPDEVLRKMGGTRARVFGAILADAHVMGEVRSMRGNLGSYDFDVVAGGSAPADLEAQRLCRQIIAAQPSPYTTFDDLLWQAYSATLYGTTVAEVSWDTAHAEGWMPWLIRQVPQRRLGWTHDHELRIITRDQIVHGIPAGSHKFLVWRHMPSTDQPYGESLLSRCFWPKVFKTGGFKYYTKFCEKYGVPWAIGKVPAGTEQKARNRMLAQLEHMVEAAVAVLDEDTSIELVEKKGGGGDPVQAKLIEACNREISKALTSQTQNTEVGSSGGTRATAQSHGARQADGNTADRRMVRAGLDCLWQWVAEFNVPGAEPPKSQFRRESVTPIEKVDDLRSLNEMIDLSESWVRRTLKAPKPENPEDTIAKGSLRPLAGAGGPEAVANGELPDRLQQFARQAHHAAHQRGHATERAAVRAADEADAAIARDLIDPIRELLVRFEREGRTLAELPDAIVALYPTLDDSALRRVTETALQASVLDGMDEARQTSSPAGPLAP